MLKEKVRENGFLIDLSGIVELDDDKLYDLCTKNKEIPFERTSEGELMVMLPVGSEGGSQESILIMAVGVWNKKHKLGKVFSSAAGFILPNKAMLSPDVSFITNERWESISKEERKKFAPLCPDFIVELMSESDRLKHAQDKMKEWMQNGCRLGWLIDPKEEMAYIYRKDGSFEVINSFDKKLSGEDVLHDFEFHLDELRDS